MARSPVHRLIKIADAVGVFFGAPPATNRRELEKRALAFGLALNLLADDELGLITPESYAAEWKWDGIRVQAVRDGKTARLYSRTGEDVSGAFPDLVDGLDFEGAIEATLIQLKKSFQLKKVLYDPYMMQASAQRLARQGVPIEEFPQTVPNLTSSTQNLLDLIDAQRLLAYPDPAIRLAMSRAITVESARGIRISKDKQSHKIDVIVALGMACLAAAACALPVIGCLAPVRAQR